MIQNILKTCHIHPMTLNNLIVIFILFLFLIGKSLWAADTIQKGDVLSLQQCVHMALKHHPAIYAAAGVIRQSESKIGQARAGFIPRSIFKPGIHV